MPHVLNAYIAGYLGYLELEYLAGYPESSTVRNEFDRLLALRTTNFSKDTADLYLAQKTYYYCRAINSARNFMFLVPELADHFRDNILLQVQDAVDEYEYNAPYWFVSRLEAVFGEGTAVPLYDYGSIFLAKAWILQANQQELTKYLDVPAVEVGDLYYIQNLVAAIEAEVNP
jgi:hypothetical protein